MPRPALPALHPVPLSPLSRRLALSPAGPHPGVFYASVAVETAIAEAAFYRLLFFAESPATPWSVNPSQHTAFAVRYGSAKAIDSGAPAVVTAPQALDPSDRICAVPGSRGPGARGGIEIIRYGSVRDPEHRANVALLTCRAFRATDPAETQSWRIRLGPAGIQAMREFPKASLEFGRDAFAADPRLARFRWER